MEKLKVHKPTIEELKIEIAKIRQSHSEYVTGDENRRIEFAKAFNWLEKRQQYDYSDKFRTPTWTEIFVKIGKLLASKYFYDLEGNVSELECKLENLEQKIIKEIHPNL